MKLSIAPIAAAVGLALAGAAHAQLPALPNPAMPTTASPAANGSGLILVIWNSNGSQSETLNLGNYSYDQIIPVSANPSITSGNFTPDSPVGSFVSASSPNAAAYSGNVLQLNFGTVPNFSTNFGSILSTTNFGVYAADQGSISLNDPGLDVSATSDPGLNAFNGAAGASSIGGQSAGLASMHVGQFYDATGASSLAAQGNLIQSGQLNANLTTGGLVGQAQFFYQGDANTGNETQFANATGNGFWNLSSSGDLTWNLPEAVAAVPLPAAAWLLASGLAGLGAVARRRRDRGLAAV